MHRILFIVFFFAVSALNAYACSCSNKSRSLNRVIKNSEIVFLGTPIETKPVNPTDCKTVDFSHISLDLKSMTVCSGTLVTRFRVTTPIKGYIGETFDIIHHENGGSCGVSFKLNEPTFIIASAREGEYRTHLCSRFGHNLETFQAYAETSPQERSCMEQISEAYEPLMEQEALKAYIDLSTEKEPYSLSMLNLDPVCEAYWPKYQETFGSLGAKTFHAIISAPIEPVRVEPEMRHEKDVNTAARPVFKYLISLALLSLAVLAMFLMSRRAMSS